MSRKRPPAVAGSFYPSDPREIRTMIDRFLDEGARAPAQDDDVVPKAVIVPHAGYIYSGPTAGYSYRRLAAGRETVRRVVLVGPSHFIPFRGIAIPEADELETPLGSVWVDREWADRLRDLPFVTVSDHPHRREHSLEVQLPFLQIVLDRFSLVPLAVGDASAEETGEALDRLWGGDETVIVISTDLSHYHPYDAARRIDSRTAEAITNLARTNISPEEACGCRAVNGMIHAAKEHGLAATLLDLRNSGDTAGPRDQVVGYGAWALDAG